MNEDREVVKKCVFGIYRFRKIERKKLKEAKHVKKKKNNNM